MQSASEQVKVVGFEVRQDAEKPWIWRVWDVGHQASCNHFPVLEVDTNGAGEDLHETYARVCASALNARFTPSPAPMVEQAGEVIQADRDTAADYWLAAFRHDSANLDAQFIREGRQDGKPLVQAFARHRLNTRPAPAETEGVGEDVIERAATAMSAAHGFAWENCAQDQWRDDARIAFAASTPPVNAGMLRERAISAAYLAIYGEGMDPFEHPEGWEYATAIADAIHAVLNSQAHQIREGDHG